MSIDLRNCCRPSDTTLANPTTVVLPSTDEKIAFKPTIAFLLNVMVEGNDSACSDSSTVVENMEVTPNSSRVDVFESEGREKFQYSTLEYRYDYPIFDSGYSIGQPPTECVAFRSRNVTNAEGYPEKSRNEPYALMKKQKRSKRKKKDPKAPKHPMSAYLFYLSSRRRALSKQYPNYGVGMISKLVAIEWKSLSDEEKGPFVEQSELDKLRYSNEIIQWHNQSH
jgi:hypothetical protein